MRYNSYINLNLIFWIKTTTETVKKVPSLFGVPLDKPVSSNLFSKEPLFKFGAASIFSKK